MAQKLKTAVFLTGAAARISQEVAMLDKLIEKKGLKLSQNDTLLAGFSSGSLNIAAINGAFSNTPAFDWNTYYKQEILFKLTNDQVFKPFPKDHKLFPLLDTTPLRNTLNGFLAKMNATVEGDLPFASNVLTFAHWGLKTRWAYSLDSGNRNLNLSDLFMASTAIPFLFPAQSIGSNIFKRRNFPYGKFSDGGTGGTFKRFEENLDSFIATNGALETMYIISPMREKGETQVQASCDDIHAQFSQTLDFSKIKDFVANISLHGFVSFLKKLQEWNTNNSKIKNIFVSLPSMDTNFGMLDFGCEEPQYYKVCEWVENNLDQLAVPIQQYIDEHK